MPHGICCALVPLGRTSFPTLIDFTLHNGTFTYGGSSGAPIKLQMETLTINTRSDAGVVG
jgi:hypothetical protein